jgi:hypothetical protein
MLLPYRQWQRSTQITRVMALSVSTIPPCPKFAVSSLGMALKFRTQWMVCELDTENSFHMMAGHRLTFSVLSFVVTRSSRCGFFTSPWSVDGASGIMIQAPNKIVRWANTKLVFCLVPRIGGWQGTGDMQWFDRAGPGHRLLEKGALATPCLH